MKHFIIFLKKVATNITFIGMIASLFMFARTVNKIVLFKEMHPTESTILLLIAYIILAIVFASIYMKLWAGKWYLWSKNKVSLGDLHQKQQILNQKAKDNSI